MGESAVPVNMPSALAFSHWSLRLCICRPQALSCNSPFDGEHSHVQHKRMIARLQPLIAKCSDTGNTQTSSMAQVSWCS